MEPYLRTPNWLNWVRENSFSFTFVKVMSGLVLYLSKNVSVLDYYTLLQNCTTKKKCEVEEHINASMTWTRRLTSVRQRYATGTRTHKLQFRNYHPLMLAEESTANRTAANRQRRRPHLHIRCLRKNTQRWARLTILDTV